METGDLCVGKPTLPPGCVGQHLCPPGIQVRAEHRAGLPGELHLHHRLLQPEPLTAA